MSVSTEQKIVIRDFLHGYRGLHALIGNVDGLNYQKISIDSRTIESENLFVAISGENHDGHQFVAQALEKQASGAVVRKKWAEQNWQMVNAGTKPIIVVEDTINFLQQLAAWHRKHFSLPVIGITGSNGKTTTREMIAHTLATHYDQVLRSRANKNNHIGLPLMLLQINPQTEVAVIEMGTNHPGEIGLLTNLTVPSMGLITNIGKGHIGFFGSLEAIYQEKIALFEAIDHSAPIFLNMEDPFLQNYPQGNRCVIRIGTDKQYEVWGKIKSVDRLGRVTFSLNGESSVHLNIPGQHNFYNALLAAAVGLHFEIGEQKIKQALEEFRPTSQRMEVIEKDGILFINDTYNANPDSMRAAVNYVSRPNISKGKRILVLGDMLELGDFSEKEHYNLGEYIATKPIDYVFLYGPDGKNLLDAIQKKAPVEVRAYWYNTHNEIKIHLSKVLHAGDVVLVKGSRGMAMEKVLESWWS